MNLSERRTKLEKRGSYLNYAASCFRRGRSTLPRSRLAKWPELAFVSVNLLDPSGFIDPPATSTGTGSSLCPLSFHGVEWSQVTQRSVLWSLAAMRRCEKNPESISSILCFFKSYSPS